MDLQQQAENEGVIRELVRGRQLAAQLRTMLRDRRLDSIDEVIDEIADTFNRVIGELSSGRDVQLVSRSDPVEVGASGRDQQQQPQQGGRRREHPFSEMMLVADPVEDGHVWKKYGQKRILGAKYPRHYYRCSQYKDQHCEAKKHVQRTDEPGMYQVTYIRKHSCRSVIHTSDTTSPSSSQHWLNFETDKSMLHQWNNWSSTMSSGMPDSREMIRYDNPPVEVPVPRQQIPNSRGHEQIPNSHGHEQSLDQSNVGEYSGSRPLTGTYCGGYMGMPSSSNNTRTSIDDLSESFTDLFPDENSPFDRL